MFTGLRAPIQLQDTDADNADTDAADATKTYESTPIRRDIRHKHHKQRLCKIFSSRVGFHFVNVLHVCII